MPHEPDIKGLKEFYNEGDKNSPRFFAGRHELISAIEATVNRLRNEIRQLPISDVHPQQQTWLIQGAPGVGKTALQWYLRDRWLADKDGPIVVNALLGDLSDRHQLTARIADRMLPNGADQLMTERAVPHTTSVTTKVSFSHTTSESVQRSTLVPNDLVKLYNKPKSHWFQRLLPFGNCKIAAPRPIVLIIDEIQAMNSDAGEVLHDLHVGVAGLPVIPLLAGLAWSQERLQEAGIFRFTTDRMSHVQTMAPLRPEEAAESVKLMLKEHYVTGKEMEDIANWTAELSDGWPQHLHHYMRGLAGELAANSGELSKVNRDSVRAEGDATKLSYYKERITNPEISSCTAVLAEAARLIGRDGCSYSELKDLLESRRWRQGLRSTETLPEDMKPQEFIQKMIRSDMIHSDGRRVQIPIPSFRRFLIEHYKADRNSSAINRLNTH